MSRYSKVAMILHWLMALMIVCLFVAGLWMHEAIEEPETRAQAFKVYQLHKSFGITVLLLTLLRLAWRLMHKPPTLPTHMKNWERLLAKVSHIGFYLLMLAVPLSGWAMVSTSAYGLPTIIFGLFEWPHIGPLAAIENKAPVEHLFKEAHELLAFAMIGLLLLHIVAALKHHFLDKDDVLVRMLPLVRQR
jgi:cytochrome b561